MRPQTFPVLLRRGPPNLIFERDLLARVGESNPHVGTFGNAVTPPIRGNLKFRVLRRQTRLRVVDRLTEVGLLVASVEIDQLSSYEIAQHAFGEYRRGLVREM